MSSGTPEAARSAGVEGQWRKPGVDQWASGQAWIGSLESAARAYGGELVGPASDAWILAERDGRPVALKLQPIDLPDSLVVWVVAGKIVAVDCK